MHTATLIIVEYAESDSFRVMLGSKLLWATRPKRNPEAHAAAYARLAAWATATGYRVIDSNGKCITGNNTHE